MKTRYCVGSLLVAFLSAGVLSGVNCPGGIGIPTSADLTRGGSLYDKWWVVAGATEPTTDHPLYTAAGSKSGSDTWRCKECHGWDYKGKDGAYATGSHSTGIAGIFGTTKTAQEVFDLIKTDHGFGAAGLSDTDIWDLVKFVLDADGAQFDTSTIIDSSNKFTGNAATGSTLFSSGIGSGLACSVCHGADGKSIVFGDESNPEYVGTIANDNPWEFQHKVRFGQPNEAMPASTANGGTTQNVNDVGTHAQTLEQ